MKSFFRYSPFALDRRINFADGSVLSGTFATTERDATLVPFGLVAVSRFALPNHFHARSCFELRPPAGTPIYCGNSVHALGQAGEGVEILFAAGCSI